MDEEENATGFDKIGAALAHFQGEVPTVAKTKRAQVKSDKGSYSYTYAGLADVTETAMPLLSKHGLAFITTPANGVLTGMLLHESGQSITGSLPITGGTPQQIGSSLTYARRYLLGCLTGVVTDDDDDGQIAEDAASRKRQSAQPAATRTMSRQRSPQSGGVAEPIPPGTGASPPPATPPPPSVPELGPPPSSGTDPAITKPQMAKLHALLNEQGLGERDAGLAAISDILDREVDSTKTLSKADAGVVIDRLETFTEDPPEPPMGEDQ